MDKIRRRQMMVDQGVQGTLVWRAVSYWLLCLMTVALMVFCWTVYTSPPQPALMLLQSIVHHYAPALVASVLLLPLVVVDMLRVSNRFAGPIYHLRGAMKRLAAGEEVRSIQFRNNDYWSEVAEDFNAIASRLQRS